MAMGLLLAVLDFTTTAADEFHDWYDLEHIPERLSVPGFLKAQRWISTEKATLSVATYDLEAYEVINGPGYRAITQPKPSPWTQRLQARYGQVMRFTGEQLVPGDQAGVDGAGGLLVVGMNIDEEVERDFQDWYDKEHLPLLAAVPGVLLARRYRSPEGRVGGLRRYAAVYHLTSPEVCTSAAWKAAVETPWTARIRPHMRDFLRVTCRPYVRAG